MLRGHLCGTDLPREGIELPVHLIAELALHSEIGIFMKRLLILGEAA